MSKKLVFLFDVDNTLLDNGCVTADLERHLKCEAPPLPSRTVGPPLQSGSLLQ